MTAIGQSVVVIHGTTITYGPNVPSRSTLIDGDTIIIGPEGVVAHGTTVGGVLGTPGQTNLVMADGATITELGKTAVVIGGTTYNVGPGAAPTTITHGGEVLTVGPSGVSDSTYTFPINQATTTTILPGPHRGAGTATATMTDAAAAQETAKNAGAMARPDLVFGIMGSCIALGAGVWAQLFC